LAGSITDAYEIDLLKATTGQATTILTTTPLANVYVALVTTTPTDAAAGTEVTGGSYARVQSAGSWGTPSAGSVTNTGALTFAAPTANWGTVVGFEIWTAVTAGTRIAWGTLTTNKTVNNGDAAPSFPASSLTITAD
jgi:hypothetical protein